MKKLVLLLCALSLAGCASEQQFVQQHFTRPQRHVVAPVVKPVAEPVTTAPEAKPAPVTVTPLHKPRWYDSFKNRIHRKKKDK